MKALYFERFGDPGVLKYGDVPEPAPSQGSAIVRTQAIGLNFADVYRRRGDYHLAGDPPYILGYEAAGVIEAVDGGPDDPHWAEPGARVAFADSPFANAELVRVPLEKLIPLPQRIEAPIAAAVLLQGLTAQYLVEDSQNVQPGERVLVHAAAGGVGLLLIQLLKLRGALVTALTSSDEKGALARSFGADEALRYDQSWEKPATPYDVAYDSVGTTLHGSLAVVRTGGTVVFYGMAGGDPKPVDPRVLMDGSKTLTGGDLWNVLDSGEKRIAKAGELFALLERGELRVHIDREFALRDGAEAHRYIESRKSKGKVLLVP